MWPGSTAFQTICASTCATAYSNCGDPVPSEEDIPSHPDSQQRFLMAHKWRQVSLWHTSWCGVLRCVLRPRGPCSRLACPSKPWAVPTRHPTHTHTSTEREQCWPGRQEMAPPSWSPSPLPASVRGPGCEQVQPLAQQSFTEHPLDIGGTQTEGKQQGPRRRRAKGLSDGPSHRPCSK